VTVQTRSVIHLHRGRRSQPAVTLAEVIVRQMRHSAAQSFSHFLLKAFVTRVSRRIYIRILRFCRST